MTTYAQYVKSAAISKNWSPRTAETIDREFERIYRILSTLSVDVGTVTDGAAPTSAEYVLGVADAALPNARIPADSGDIAWNLGTPGVISAAFAERGALSVIGNPTNAPAAPIDIVAGAASTVLKRNTVNQLEFAKADLTQDVTGRLPYANVVAATAASRLLGRGSAAGGGDWQEVTLGAGLLMSGTELQATASGGSYYEPVTDGDLTQPELIFADGDVVMAEVP